MNYEVSPRDNGKGKVIADSVTTTTPIAVLYSQDVVYSQRTVDLCKQYKVCWEKCA